MSCGRGLSAYKRFVLTLSSPLHASRTSTSVHRNGLRPPKYSSLNFKRCLASHGASPNELNTLIDLFRVSLSAGDRISVRNAYEKLADGIKEMQVTHSEMHVKVMLDRQDLFRAIEVLGSSGRFSHDAIVEKILSDMPVLFGIPLTLDVHSHVLQSLINCDHNDAALTWIVSMERKPGQFSPSVRQWTLLLKHLAEKGDISRLTEALVMMRRRQPHPLSDHICTIVIDGLLETSPSLDDLSTIIWMLKKDGRPSEPYLMLRLWKTYSAQPALAPQAKMVEEYYNQLYASVYGSPEEETIKRNEALAQKYQSKGLPATLTLYKSYELGGFKASPGTLNALVGGSYNVKELLALEREIGIKADSSNWALLIENALRSLGLRSALSVYYEARASGFNPHSHVVGLLLRAILASCLLLDNGAVNQALGIYRDLIRSRLASHSTSQTDTTAAGGEYDRDVFNTLLRILTTSPNPEKYLSIAQEAVENMRLMDVSMDSTTLTSLTMFHLRASSDFVQAFDAYKQIHNSEPGGNVTTGGGLDHKGYLTILQAYCRLPFAQTSILPPDLYFKIVDDMRAAGYAVTQDLYDLPLQQLRSIAERPPGVRNHTFWKELRTAIRRLHNFLSVESSFNPSVLIWNQLMDAYQHAGRFGDAYRIWETLMFNGKFDNVGLSVILKACESADEHAMAFEICSKLVSTGFMFNQDNWNSWLQCLCRAGRLNDAVRVLCLEMGKGQEDVAPDAKSVGIVMKFASQMDQCPEVQSRIRRYLPDLWKTLPATLKTQ